MKYWYEMTDVLFVTIDYGRYEAVQTGWSHSYTWTPVLAGPQPLA